MVGSFIEPSAVPPTPIIPPHELAEKVMIKLEQSSRSKKNGCMFDRVMNGDQLNRNQSSLVAGISHPAEGDGCHGGMEQNTKRRGDPLIRPMIGVVCSFGHTSREQQQISDTSASGI